MRRASTAARASESAEARVEAGPTWRSTGARARRSAEDRLVGYRRQFEKGAPAVRHPLRFAGALPFVLSRRVPHRTHDQAPGQSHKKTRKRFERGALIEGEALRCFASRQPVSGTVSPIGRRGRRSVPVVGDAADLFGGVAAAVMTERQLREQQVLAAREDRPVREARVAGRASRSVRWQAAGVQAAAKLPSANSGGAMRSYRRGVAACMVSSIRPARP